jgi:5-methylcytosine-specific restriction endonuclease McrA
MKRGKPLKRSGNLKRSPLPKRKTRIRQRSKKMEAKYVDRREFVVKILSTRPYCEACPKFAKHDGLTTYNRFPSRDVHELVRRSQGGSILDEQNVLAVCRKCHDRIGREPRLAFDLGLAKHGWER